LENLPLIEGFPDVYDYFELSDEEKKYIQENVR